VLDPVTPLFFSNAYSTGWANSEALGARLADAFAVAGLFILIFRILAILARKRLALRHTSFSANAIAAVLE